ncbi:MAG: 3-deoxy-7-phosphoheptulonate synthase [Chloroflexota bacterium]|nr:3-deoxy-7-phosphoheptulonate synthase [Chloroflexota bacterium]
MIVIMKRGASPAQIDHVVDRLTELGYGINLSGTEVTVIGAIGVLDDDKARLSEQLGSLPEVERVVPVLKRFKLASREFHPDNSVVRVRHVSIGDGSLVLMAGPCAVESEGQLMATARAVKAAGGDILRGGAFKPRTSPYDFQGLGSEGLRLLAAARDETGMPVISEVLDPHDVELCAQYVDILQIGARNMQNYSLLREVGRSGHPVLLKRGGMYPTIENWLLSAEYVLREGNRQIVMCERGLPPPGGETATRNVLDLSAVAVIHELSHLPVVVDPSHGTGKSAYVPALARGAAAVGADGLLIEVHPEPERALSDGPQSLTPAQFAEVAADVRAIEAARRPTGQAAVISR